MKFSEQWLRAWVSPAQDIEQICDKLTMVGLELASIEPVSKVFNHVVIGQIVELNPHPKKENLKVCQIDVGEAKKLTLVTGADNLKVKDKVPVATVGSKLPGSEQTISTRDFAGVVSQGMLCSQLELGLGEDNSGVLVLESHAPIGQQVYDFYHLDDRIVEIDLTPNRGDCLSIKGIAREVGVTNHLDINPIPIEAIEPSIDDTMMIAVDDSNACPKYACRVIRNVNSQAVSPLWLQERLRRSGLRSISPIVDVTNYVMLELGQPMHAFDLATITGKIHVRYAYDKEKLTLLDGKEIELTDDVLLIADENEPKAMAGIMGGEHSGVSAQTQDILLECAHFSPLAISGKARRYGFATDSSYRFERGVDPNLVHEAMERATELLLSIVGGQAGPVNAEVTAAEDEWQPVLELRRARVERILGVCIKDEVIQETLTRLGIGLEASELGWRCQIPSHRFDLRIEEDLIEEVARIYGYEHIFASDNIAQLMQPQDSEQLVDSNRLVRMMADMGYQEFITYSFVDDVIQRQLFPEQSALALLNPISQDLSMMRLSLWPGLLNALSYNQKRQVNQLRCFETGLCFVPSTDGLQQVSKIGGLISSVHFPEQWSEDTRAVDFYDLKGDVERILDFGGNAQAFSFVPGKHCCLHPGQTAYIEYQGKTVGVLGQLHPQITQNLDLKGPVFLFECELEPVQVSAVPQQQLVSKFPAIRRDLAIVVDKQVTWQQVSDIVRHESDQLLNDLHLFDVYQGPGIEKNKKSLALGLTLRHRSRTLIDSEVNEVVEAVVRSLKDELSATIRE